MKRYIKSNSVLDEKVVNLLNNDEFKRRVSSKNDLSTVSQNYSSVDELAQAGFKGVRDFSVSILLKKDKIIVEDYQPWNNIIKYYLWDEDFKQWTQVAERKV